jgi:hypothetical protein
MKTSTNETWIFIFNFRWNTTEDFIVASVHDFFRDMVFITLNANIYIVARTESLLMFEIYKKSFNSGLTINLLCEVEMAEKELQRKNQLKKWNRRSDLTGVHFLVGYISCAFIFENNEVRFQNWFSWESKTNFFAH